MLFRSVSQSRYGVVTLILVMSVAMVCCAILGIVIERVAYRPLRQSPKINALITSIGVSLLLEYGGQLVLGPDPQPFPELIRNTPLLNRSYLVLGSIPVLVLGLALGLMVVMHWIIQKTKIGMAVRAVSQHQPAAQLMGISVDRVVMFTFAVGSALAAAGGILYALLYPSINPLMGIFPGLKAFIAVVLGGIGSIPGAVAAGFLIGMIETLVTGYISPTYRDAIAFVILVAVLLFKPSGLFGKTGHEKV